MIICRVCEKDVNEIRDYITSAEREGVDVETFVIDNDGLYDSITDTVVCTSCYAHLIATGRAR